MARPARVLDTGNNRVKPGRHGRVSSLASHACTCVPSAALGSIENKNTTRKSADRSKPTALYEKNRFSAFPRLRSNYSRYYCYFPLKGQENRRLRVLTSRCAPRSAARARAQWLLWRFRVFATNQQRVGVTSRAPAIRPSFVMVIFIGGMSGDGEWAGGRVYGVCGLE